MVFATRLQTSLVVSGETKHKGTLTTQHSKIWREHARTVRTVRTVRVKRDFSDLDTLCGFVCDGTLNATTELSGVWCRESTSRRFANVYKRLGNRARGSLGFGLRKKDASTQESPGHFSLFFALEVPKLAL